MIRKLLESAKWFRRTISACAIRGGDKLQEIERRLIDYTPSSPIPPAYLERLFYPPNKGKRVAAADKVILPIILFSAAYLFVENEVEKDIPGSQLFFSILFLLIFIPEFIIRLYLKRLVYMKSWGIIDLIAIVGDIAFVASVVLSALLIPEDWEYAKAIRALRFARFLRFLRILRFASYFSLVREVFFRSVPYFKVLTLSILIFLTILGGPAVFGYLFLDLDIVRLWEFIELTFKKFTKIEPSSGDNNLDENIANIYQLMIATFLLLSAEFIVVLFAPAARRIAENSKANVTRQILTDHVIIYVGKDHDLLEEIIYVFQNYEKRRVFFILSDTEEIDTPFPKSALRYVGSIDSRETWNAANSAQASNIILFNQECDLPEALLFTIIDPEEHSTKLPRILIVENSTEYDRRIDVLNQYVLDVTRISINQLRDVIGQAIWNTSSPQYAFYTELIDHLDEKFVFPTGRKEGDPKFDLASLNLGGIDLNKCHIENFDNTVLIRPMENESGDDPDVSDSYLVYATERLIKNNPDAIKNINVFCYVNDFYLFECNKLYKPVSDIFVNIFAIEFAIALAIYHEIKCPNILPGWLLEGEAIEESSRAIGSRIVGNYWRRSEVSDSCDLADLLYVVRKDGSILLFTDEHEKRLILDGDCAVGILANCQK